MDWCVLLARAETHTGALDWFDSPITDLQEWTEAVNRVGEAIEKKTKQGRV